jgi:hypothetical protein
MLRSHASGRETWAATLDSQAQSRLGVIEVDQGGRPAVLAVLAAAAERGLSAIAIAVDNPLSGHAGGHVMFIYAEPAPVGTIVAQLREVATAAGLPDASEIWPCNQVIRLPFGYHRWARTRGELLTQHGEIFILDDVNERADALDLVRWIRNRLAALEIWIPVSQALALEPPPTPAIAVRQPRRRRAAAPPAELPHLLAGEQLQLPIGNSAGGFALVSAASSPALTSSPDP